jgi:hypothetical protein
LIDQQALRHPHLVELAAESVAGSWTEFVLRMRDVSHPRVDFLEVPEGDRRQK